MKWSSWIAIDDEPGRYPRHLENVVLTDPAVCFSESDATRLSQLFGAQTAA